MALEPFRGTPGVGGPGWALYRSPSAGGGHVISHGPSAQETTGPGGPAIDPRSFVATDLKRIEDEFRQWDTDIRETRIGVADYNSQLARRQAIYDNSKRELTGAMAQMDYIQQLTESGAVDPEAAREMQLRTIGMSIPSAPRGVTPSATGVSPAGMTAYTKRFETVREGMLEYVGGKKWYRWDTKQASKKKMMERYFNERRIAGLNDPRNANKIPGFNQAFVESMGEDDRTADMIETLLDPDTGDPRMLAAFAPSSAVTRGFLNQFGVTKQRQGISPLGRSVASALPKPAPQRQTPIRQWSESRGQTRVSHDGGKTWQIE